MKISLRKANALENAIKEHISTIEAKADLSINEFQTAQVEITKARTALIANDARRAALLSILYNVRSLVGRANVESGVSELLTHAAFIEKRQAQLKLMTESTATESEAVVDGKLQRIRDNKSEHRSYGYNDSVTVGVLTAEQIAGYKALVLQLKKEKQSINDKVLELNVRTEITINDNDVAMLQSEQLV